MKRLEALLAQALAEPLASARAAAARGQAVIGLTGEDLPRELVHAAGAWPLRLPAAPAQATPLANRFLESGFLPAHRAITQLWLAGALDFMSAVVFSRANDSAQRLYYYLCELQRTGRAKGPRPLLYDLAKIPRRSSLVHTERATRRLAEELGAPLAQLPAAIEITNRRRRLWAALDAARRGPSPPRGEWSAQLLRLAGLYEPASFDTALEEALSSARPRWSGPRLQLAGSTPPDERLHLAIAAAGGCVVQESGEGCLAPLAVPLEWGSDPCAAIAQHYHRLNYGPRAWEDYAAQVVAQAKAARANGVVLWLIEEDEALAWHVPALRQQLSAHGIPLLCLTRQRWDASPAALAPIGAFVRGLGAPA